MGKKWNAIGRWFAKNWPKLLEGFFRYKQMDDAKDERRRKRG